MYDGDTTIFAYVREMIGRLPSKPVKLKMIIDYSQSLSAVTNVI